MWILLIVGIGITIYGLLFLLVLGSSGHKQGWKIIEGHIVSREGREFHPTFVRDRSEYNQTDAFNGYSHYFLELHSDTELLATNAYNSKDDFKRDIGRVRELTNARQLDLVWTFRVGERKWMVAAFPDEWALFLCGPLDRRSEEDRIWWRNWLYPEFAARMSIEVEALDAIERLRRLAKEYGTEMANRNSSIAEFANRAQRVLLSEGPIIALSRERFYKQLDEVHGNASSILHDGDFMELGS